MGLCFRAAQGAAVVALSLAAVAAGRAQTLTMGVGAPVTSVDPHYHQLSPNTAVAHMIFSGLTTTDGHARVVPDLAESWKAIDATTWEFRLRPGVRFHNGSEFTAEDVAFTFARVPNVPNSPSSYAIYTRPIREVQVVDAHTLRLKTAVPYPLMPTDLASIMILDKETHAAATTEGSMPARWRSAPGRSAWSATATAIASSSSATTAISAPSRPGNASTTA